MKKTISVFILIMLFYTSWASATRDCLTEFSIKFEDIYAEYHQDLIHCEEALSPERCRREAELSYGRQIDQAAEDLYYCLL
ncbi:MAG: hypothetical protein IPN20_12165 [Haliscomenobacter sp.]|nr:hypothetical protein [Haliscomenobacter sp.]